MWEKVGFMLYGSFFHTLDEKGRLLIPSRIRSDLDGRLFVLKGYEGTLLVYPEAEFNKYISSLDDLDDNSKNSRDIKRIVLSSVFEIDVDSKSRMQLPASLLKKYEITSEVIIIGMINHLEIWDKTKWENYLKDNEPDYEQKCEKLLESING